jgi:putative addiction module component (TIGR02574 family)
MPVTLQSLGLDRLSRNDRLALVQALWDSIAGEVPQALLTETHRKELERRADEDVADPEGGVAWEVVKAQARTEIRK